MVTVSFQPFHTKLAHREGARNVRPHAKRRAEAAAAAVVVAKRESTRQARGVVKRAWCDSRVNREYVISHTKPLHQPRARNSREQNTGSSSDALETVQLQWYKDSIYILYICK